jgi:hypothetical protein
MLVNGGSSPTQHPGSDIGGALMAVLTIREIYDTARAAGFGEREAVTWTAIALAESEGRTD